MLYIQQKNPIQDTHHPPSGAGPLNLLYATRETSTQQYVPIRPYRHRSSSNSSIRLFSHLASTASGVDSCPTWCLRDFPYYDNLRDEPAFATLIAEQETRILPSASAWPMRTCF